MKKKRNSTLRVAGFRFAGVSAGLKENKKLDLALIVSDRPAKAVAVFTTNRLKAAPVLQGERVIRGRSLQAVVCNSGNANAGTGERGLRDAFKTAGLAAKALAISPKKVLVSSTGKIGVPLAVHRIAKALPNAVRSLSPQGLSLAARAMMTTDAFPKVHSVQGRLNGKPYSILGLAKGAGMIEPHMATMLAYIVTDLDLSWPAMKRSFSEAVERSFNSISVDGDTSTNDTALFLANGAAKIPTLKAGSKSFRQFEKHLLEVCERLAWMMVQDGEGATKVVEVRVRGAKSPAAAKRIAYCIARSQLVKTSFFGEDPNWGRVFAALGYSGETFNPSRVDIYYGPVPLVRNGLPTRGASEKKAHRVMRNPAFQVLVDLKLGRGEAKVWTSDLTYDYVKINAEYRT